ncbi:oxidoreductase [Elioraea sp.]|uniref:oxidoreductase n=1 Tax=Elioraea sp. TaxID=2185103 RepID=UPI0025C014B5|nr:oxidoreductase [Elioraea sp.]
MMLTRRAAIAAAAAIVATPHASAEASLPQPTGPVVLTLGGNVRATNAAGAARFDRAMLDALPQTGFVTGSPWTDKPVRFDGISGAALVDAVGAHGREATATALNDYKVTIPFTDFAAGGLLVASRIDGEVLPIRARGPLWIVYPFDINQRFRAELFYARSIWQLRSIVFSG